MDKIEKFLRKLSKKEREAFTLIMLQLKKDFSKIEITKISKRDDQKYKNL